MEFIVQIVYGCIINIVRMEEADEVADQIKYLFQEKDTESIKYIIGGENAKSIEKICEKLPQGMAATLRTMFQELPKESDDELQSKEIDENGRNKRIDEHLQRLEKEERNETFLEMLAKANEKLIYEEHFGFPFFDLVKRILITHGDSKPQQSTIKAVHSQVAILYGVLFSQALMKWLTEEYENVVVGFKEHLSSIFPRLTQKYFQFHQVYKNIKKEAAQQEQLDADDDDGDAPQISVQDDQTLDIDEKQFLMAISDAADDFQTFQKNRNYNFMVFGMRKYLAYIGLDPNVFRQGKERQFCELLSFLSLRFIRRMVFTIIRERNNNVLRSLSEPITPQQVRRIGNELVDEIAIQVADHLKSVSTTTDAQAEAIFLQQFQPYSYSDFIPRKTLNAVLQKGETRAQYAWRTHKQYRHIWGQRVKVDYYLKHGGVKPVNKYIDYVISHKREQTMSPGKAWKNFLMIQFGFVGVKLRGHYQQPTKKQKLDSCQY